MRRWPPWPIRKRMLLRLKTRSVQRYSGTAGSRRAQRLARRLLKMIEKYIPQNRFFLWWLGSPFQPRPVGGLSLAAGGRSVFLRCAPRPLERAGDPQVRAGLKVDEARAILHEARLGRWQLEGSLCGPRRGGKRHCPAGAVPRRRQVKPPAGSIFAPLDRCRARTRQITSTTSSNPLLSALRPMLRLHPPNPCGISKRTAWQRTTLNSLTL